MSNSNRGIVLRNLTKLYPTHTGDGSVTVLDKINLDIQPGEFVSLIGPSGCGKTTLLKIIDGLIACDGGEIAVAGEPLNGPRPELAFVFQSFALLPWRSVEDNVAFGLELRGIAKDEIRETVKRYLSMVGLSAFGKHFPAQLSGGMQQRVGIARALAINPRFLLMDEPFGALDAQTRNLLQADLERIWESDQKTVVFVTHAMDEAVFLSDRVIILSPRPGRVHEILDIDLPRPRNDELRSHPRFVELTNHIWDVLRGMIVRQPEELR